ncbi:MAG: hypothetical protein EHM61_03600 [Acidobacteria bacterium]|nr:MAG: hypothetical protein EHM61_03600 [Acidobacteriota bacterium]
MIGRFTSVFFCLFFTFGYSVADGDVYKNLLSFDHGKSREAVWTIENRIREANATQRVEIERQLLAALKSSQATVAAKESICRLVASIGSCGSVAKLRALLTNEELRDAARGALQSLPCPAVDKAFRHALTTAKGPAQLGFVNSVGDRRDRESVPLLAGLVKNPDPALVEAALGALGRIGGEPAAKAIKESAVPQSLQPSKADAYLRCADSLSREGGAAKAEGMYQEILREPGSGPVARAGALRGVVAVQREAALPLMLDALKSEERDLREAAARLVNELPGPSVTEQVSKAMAGLRPDTQVFLITALAVRGDPLALPEVRKLAESSEGSVQLAALEALGKLGDNSTIETLFKASKVPDPVGQTAVDSLRFVRGSAVNDTVAGFLRHADVGYRALALKTLAARRFPGTSALAFQALGDGSVRVRIEAWRTVGLVAEPASLPRLVSALLKVSDVREQQAAEQAIQAVAITLPEASRLQPLTDAFSGADSRQRSSLLRAMGRVGGEKAFATIRAALSDSDPTVQDTAVRALSDWGDQTTSGELAKLARSSSNPAHRVLGLRGYVRLASAGQGRNPEERIAMLREAVTLAERTEEKKLVLGALGGVPSAAVLDLIEPHLADKDVKNEAQAAYFRVAQSLARQEPARARTAMLKLVESSDDPAFKQQVQEAIGQLAN